MASTSKAFKKCVDPCPRYLKPDDKNTIIASFVWAKSMQAMSLRGNLRALWVFFYEKAPLSSVPLFEERGAAICFPRFGTHRCRGTEANEIVGSQLDMADELERDRPGPENLKEVFQTRRPNDTFVRTRVFHLLISLLFLSNSPATTVNSTWPRLGGNFLLRD